MRPIEFPYRFTDDERKILFLMCQGLMDKQIAFKLQIPERIVRLRITDLRRRSETRNRVQLAVWATKRKLDENRS